MNLNSTTFFILVLAGLAVASIVRGEWIDAVIAVIAALGVWANALSQQPRYRALALAKYPVLGAIAFLAVIRFSVPR